MDIQNNNPSPNQPPPPPPVKPPVKNKLRLLISIILLILVIEIFNLNTINNQNQFIKKGLKLPLPSTPASSKTTTTIYQHPSPSPVLENYEIINGSLYRILPNGNKEIFIDKSSVKNSGLNFQNTIKEIKGFELSPDKTKIILWGEDDSYIPKSYYTKINSQEFTLIGNSEGGVWSPNSKYFAYTSKHVDAGPYELTVFDTEKNDQIETITPVKNEYTSYNNLFWDADNQTIHASYISYDPHPPYGDIIASGEAEIKLK